MGEGLGSDTGDRPTLSEGDVEWLVTTEVRICEALQADAVRGVVRALNTMPYIWRLHSVECDKHRVPIQPGEVGDELGA